MSSFPDPPIVDQDAPRVFTTSIRFFWRSPPYSGNSPLSSYTLLCPSISYSNSIPFPQRSLTVPNLTTSLSYTFELFATNSNGLRSPSAFFYPIQPGAPPGPPTNPTFSTLSIGSSNAALFQWNPPISNGGSEITYNAIWFYPIDSNSNIFSNAPTSTVYEYVNGYDLSNLIYFDNPSILYKYIVRSINSVGWSADDPSYYNLFSFDRTWTPNRLNSLRLWYDANDPLNTGIRPSEGALVPTIVDKSGYGYTATSVNTTPTYSTGISSIVFAQNSYYNTNNYPAGRSNESLFVVYRTSNISTRYSIIGTNTTGGRELLLFSASNSLVANASFLANVAFSQTGSALSNQTTTANLVISNANWSIFVNGASNLASVNRSIDNATNTRIGNSHWNSNAVDFIYEVVGFNAPLSTDDRQRVEGYLAWKWGNYSYLPSSHPYKNSKPRY